MKTICFFSGDITRCGGTERISILLANELVKSADTRIIFLSLTERNSEPYFFLDERVRRYKLFGHAVSFKLFLVPIILKLFFFLRREHVSLLIDIDVILSVASVFARVGSRCRILSWEHFHFHENLGCRLRDYGRKLAKRFASSIVVLTEEDCQQYLETPAKAVITVIPNAILPETESGVTSLNHSDIPVEPFILSVGRLDYQKGFERIPAVAESIFEKYPGWKWIIVGEGPLREKIQREIEARKLTEKVLLLGMKNPYPYYRKAKFLVMTSRYEGFGLVLLEALSENCPVIAFNCKFGPADIIKDSCNGYLVEAENFPDMERRIRELLDDPDERARLAENAKKCLESFSVESFTDKWNTLIRETIWE